MYPDALPEARCGFVLEPEDVPNHAHDINVSPGAFGKSVQITKLGPKNGIVLVRRFAAGARCGTVPILTDAFGTPSQIPNPQTS